MNWLTEWSICRKLSTLMASDYSEWFTGYNSGASDVVCGVKNKKCLKLIERNIVCATRCYVDKSR